MSSVDEVKRAILKAHDAGNTEAVAELGGYLKKMEANPEPTPESTPKAPETSFAREVQFGFAEQDSDLGNLNSYITANYPAEVYNYETKTFTPLDETYGEGFEDGTPEERRVMLNERKAAKLREDFPDIYAAGSEESGAATLGNLGGALASPTTLAPLGHSLKAAAGIGALLGLEMNVLDQQVQKGEVDAGEAAIATVASAVLAPTLLKAGRIAGKKLGERRERIVRKEADKAVDTINSVMAKGVIEGVPTKDMGVYVQKATGMSKEELSVVAVEATKKPHLPSMAEAKMIESADVDSLSRVSNSGMENLFGVISTRLGKHSPKLKWKLRKMDMDTHVKTYKAQEAVKPFMKLVNKVPSCYNTREA